MIKSFIFIVYLQVEIIENKSILLQLNPVISRNSEVP